MNPITGLSNARASLAAAVVVVAAVLALAAAPASADPLPNLGFDRSIPLGDASNTPYGLVLSPDGSAAYVGYSGPTNSIYVVDLGDDTVASVASGGPAPAALAVTPDGSRVWAANTDSSPSSVSVIDPSTPSVEQTFPVPAGGRYPSSIAISADGAAAFVSVGSTGGPAVARIATGTGSSTVFAPTSPLQVPAAVATDPFDSDIVYIGGSAATGGAVERLDAAGIETPVVLPLSGAPVALAVSDDGAWLYAATIVVPSLVVIDLSDFSVDSTFALPELPGDIAVAPDGTTVYVTQPNSGTLLTVDTTAGTVGSFGLGYVPRTVAVSPDGTRLYVTDVTHGALAVYEVRSATPTPTPTPSLAPADDDTLPDTGADAALLPFGIALLLVGAVVAALVATRRRTA